MNASGPRGRRISTGLTYAWAWPGVPQLWQGGEWGGLGWAVAFAMLLNAQLLSSFLYTELLPTKLVTCGWLLVGGSWIGGIVVNRRWARRQIRTADARKLEETLYGEAFHDYLQRNWVAAESKCRELIRRRRHDVDARLLLATVLRHAGRLEEAAEQLNWLVKLEGAEKWTLEIALERRSLDEAREKANNSEIEEGDAGSDGSQPATLSMVRHAEHDANLEPADDTSRPVRVIRNAA